MTRDTFSRETKNVPVWSFARACKDVSNIACMMYKIWSKDPRGILYISMIRSTAIWSMYISFLKQTTTITFY